MSIASTLIFTRNSSGKAAARGALGPPGVLLAAVLGLAALFSWAPEAGAYMQWSVDRVGGNCANCHDDFRLGGNYISRKDGTAWGLDLHDGHRNIMLSGDCNTCHLPSGRFPVILDSSAGGTGFEPIACLGCHGRNEDIGGDGLSQGRGRGLRQHHQNAGVTLCSGCHSDSAGPPGVGEDAPPPYYFAPDTAHPNKPTDACNGNGSESVFGPTGLDNDGDIVEDAADSDCAANQPPVADANGPYTGTVGIAVTFDGTASADPDGTIVAYDWDFGDGNTGSGPTPAHTYTTDGVYNVTLTVTDNGGLTGLDTTTATIGIGDLPPVADPNGPYSGTVGSPVQFDGTGSSDPNGESSIVAYDWDFGDGGTGTGVSPMHTYAASGLYNVTLTVADDTGLTDSAGTTADIAEPGMLDLDIAALRVTKRVSFSRVKPVFLKLVVKNGASVEGSALATIIGVQNGMEVYNETLTVTDPVGNGRTTFDDGSVPPVPPYTPMAAGDILWTATIADDDLDLDEATAVTRVVP